MAKMLLRRLVPETTVDGFIGAVGNTPLIHLSKLSQETGCTILGKAEFMNPGMLYDFYVALIQTCF